MISEHLAPDNAEKAKKSLIFVSCCTLLFATFDFNENVLSFLGLEIVVSQEKVVRVGQLSCLLLITIYALRELPNIIEKLARYYFARLEKMHNRVISYAQEDMFGPYEEDDYGPTAHIEAIKAKLDYERGKKKKLFDQMIFIVTALNITLIDILLPTFLGALTAYDPYFVQETIARPIFEINQENQQLSDETQTIENIDLD